MSSGADGAPAADIVFMNCSSTAISYFAHASGHSSKDARQCAPRSVGCITYNIEARATARPSLTSRSQDRSDEIRPLGIDLDAST
jgi:hypothetical protein